MTNVAVESASEACVDLCKEKKIRVLHVDDDAGFLAVAKQCLEEQGQFQVDTAISAEEALEKLRDSEYDAVVADYQMPGKNGLELLKRLKQEGSDVPFILLTCKGKEEIAIEALNSGVYQYIDKQGGAEATYEELKRSICSAVRRQRAEKLLKESENRLRQITENIQDMLLLTDRNLVCTYASSSIKWILGHDPSEIIGKPVYQFIHPDDLTKTMEVAKKVFEDRSGVRIEIRCRRADGSYALVEGVGKILTDENGQITGIVLTSRDITERKQMEETLQKSEERFRQVADNAQEWIWEVDSDGLYTYASSVVEKVLGYKPEEIVGKKHFYDLFLPEEREELKKAAFQAFAKKSLIREFFNRNVHKNGNTVWLSTSGVPIVDEKGSLLGYRGADADITERKEAEEKLKRYSEYLENIFAASPNAITVSDFNGNVVECNQATLDMLGFSSKEELIGKSGFSLIAKKDQQKAAEHLKEALEQGSVKNVEYTFLTKDGREVPAELSASAIRDSSGNPTGFVSITKDITESKKISEKANFQARLLNAVGQAIIATDTKGNITYWNRAAEQLYGWPEAEVIGRNIMDVTPAETSREQAADILKRLIAGEYWSGEFLAKRRDGTAFPAIVTDAPITNDRREFIGIIGISTDITEQKWMQEVFDDAIGKVVELNEKLRVVESLTRHDIRNKLSALNGRVYLLKKRFGENQEALQHVRDMELVSQQMLRILEFERIYVHVGAEELECVNVDQHLTEAVSLLSDLKGTKVINECHGLTVLADSLLRQLFYNLIDNSLKYGEKISRIRVHYEEEENQLKLIYEDDGVGIPEEIKTNLFNEGFGKGTGYGLYLIKRICEAYGWTIQETGKPGQGAQFIMEIPKNSKDGKRNYEIS